MCNKCTTLVKDDNSSLFLIFTNTFVVSDSETEKHKVKKLAQG